MLKIRLLKVFLILFLFISPICIVKADDGIRQAMRDEIQRSIKNLHLETLEKPYYIEYVLKLTDYHTAKATLGELTESDNEKTSVLNVGMRVGGYKFDNSNYLDFGFSFFGSGDDEEKFTNRKVPLELDYKSFRRELWLATDAAYKQVSEIYSKKLAIIKNRMRKDTTHDFLQIPPQKLYDTLEAPQFNRKKIEDLCKSLSAIFVDYPEIEQSTVGVEYIPEKIFFINSEGREYIKTHFYIGLEVVAATRAEDGMPLMNHYTIFRNNPDDLPKDDSLKNAVRILAGKLSKLRSASVLEESYSGPVMFEGQAASEIFAQVFAPNLVTQRMPLTERGVQESDRFMAFQTKIGGRVLPEFLSVNALPNKKDIEGIELLGAYIFDDDGVKAEDVLLVKNGFLKSLLSSRVPTRRVRKTNGHKRGGASMLSVIELSSDPGHSKTKNELKERMLELCRDRELEYGIIVKKVLDQNIQYTTLMRISSGNFSMSRSDKQKSLIEVYKVYQDGREELIRGVKAKGISVQSFKDILNIGKEIYVLNYLAPSITSPYFSGGSQYVGASVVVPDLLFEDCEIKPMEDDFPKPPIIINPLTEYKK
ncbi:metallopeptidase TldD-related protein [Bacteroidota bacterium]